MSLTLITDYVRPDEKAYRLVEVVMTPYAMSKGRKRFTPQTMVGRHRWQVVWVNRGDKLAQHITDMGDAKLYNRGPVNIPGLWEHTVAELREIADQWRNDSPWESEVIANAQGESRLIERFLIQQEKKQRRVAGKIVSVPVRR